MNERRTTSPPVELFSLPGHDRDCARAMLSQSRLAGTSPISDVQVEHLLAIGYRAGRQGVWDALAAAEERLTGDLSERP